MIDESCETMVVDDSTPADAARIRNACRNVGATYLRGPRSVAAKRNLGWREAKHGIVLFIDSDCRADECLLREHLSQYDADPRVGAVVGPTIMDGDDSELVWQVVAESQMYNQCYVWPLEYSQLLWCTTSNLSARREVLARVNGFDEEGLTIVGGEDVDLGIRINEAGFRIVAARRGRVYHAREPVTSIRQVCRRLTTYGRADIYLSLKHPSRRRPHRNRVALLIAAAASGLLLRRSMPGRFAHACAATSAVVAVDVWSRGATVRDLRRLLLKSLAVLMDWSFDLGAACEALRQRRPDLLMTRFHYLDPREFVPRHPARARSSTRGPYR